MERKSVRGWGVVAVLVMTMMLSRHEYVIAAGVYACYGGCYNKCILLNGKATSDGPPCYWSCLKKCTPYTSDYCYYCQLACSMELCRKYSHDGEKMEKCMGSCSNTCKP